MNVRSSASPRTLTYPSLRASEQACNQGWPLPVLQPRERKAVESRLRAELKRDVTIRLYTQQPGPLFLPGRECPTCGTAQELLQELSDLSDRITLDVVDFYKNAEQATTEEIDRIPAFVIGSNGRNDARFYGIPTGYEFAPLLDTIVAASRKDSTLSIETRRELKGLTADVHIQVFVTPTSEHCAALAHLAHAMALESPRVRSDVVEVQEFPNLGRKHNVMSVPRTIINDTVDFTGAVSEAVLLQRVLEAVGVEPTSDDSVPVSGRTTPVS